MKITMLGTGNALATECYNTCYVISDSDKHFLIDGGGGNTILHQLKVAGFDWMDIHDIFVTHKHIDHIMGIIWMIRMICQFMKHGDYKGDARIYGHEEVIALLKELSQKLLNSKETKYIGDRLHMIVVEDAEAKKIIGHTVQFFDIGSTKAKQFGFSMELDHGRKLTCCGDEPYNVREEKYAAHAAWLLHEAFCLYSERDIFDPYEKHHSTVKDACELAQKLEVENLLLYHTEDKSLKNRKNLYREEGAQYYQGNLKVPDDLEVIEL